MRSISSPGYSGWKTWGPILNTVFFLGASVWIYRELGGLIGCLFVIPILFLIFHCWWISCVLKKVGIDGENLIISDLKNTITVPLTYITEVRDRSNRKRTPSIITLSRPTLFGNKIRFFPSPWPKIESLSKLIKKKGYLRYIFTFQKPEHPIIAELRSYTENHHNVT